MIRIDARKRIAPKKKSSVAFGSPESAFARDVATLLVTEYASLTDRVLSLGLDPIEAEYAYERLLGVRGSLCRICPSSFMDLLEGRTLRTWRQTEDKLSKHVMNLGKDDILYQAARRVEERWTSSVESFLKVMSAKVIAGELRDQIGLLRGIDAIALHLAQRELFRWSDYFSVSAGNAQALKLRIRLMSLYLATQRLDFGDSYPAIRSYRETFGISDRQAYPWWFVDCDLTERQMNWTYRRLNFENMGWRFQDPQVV